MPRVTVSQEARSSGSLFLFLFLFIRGFLVSRFSFSRALLGVQRVTTAQVAGGHEIGQGFTAADRTVIEAGVESYVFEVAP